MLRLPAGCVGAVWFPVGVFVLSQFEACCAIAKQLFQALWLLDFVSNLGARCKSCAVRAPETGRGALKFPANTAWEGFMKPNIFCGCVRPCGRVG